MNKIIKLDISEEDLLSGVDAIAFVENPAIEIDFLAFAKESFESFDDYPKEAREMAQAGIDRNEALGNKCATQVGKVRAQQLAQGKPISEETIVRMRAFLIRQKDNYDLAVREGDYDRCGWISYALWGGPSALRWAEKKLKQLGYEFTDETTNEAYEVACSETECSPIELQEDCGCGCDEFDLDEACQPGYKALGTKIKNGRVVPNCIPADAFNKIMEGLITEFSIKEKFEKIGEGGEPPLPIYSTIEEARAQNEKYGCPADSYHQHTLPDGRIGYMPCQTHGELLSKHKDDEKKYYSDLEDKVRDAIMASLDGVALTQDSLEAQGYVEVEDNVLFDAYNRIKTIKSDPTASSIEDFGDFKVLYRYSKSPAAERDFCVELQKLTRQGKLFRREDINNLSIKGTNTGFGLNGTDFYDIFAYKGGANCRHRWERVIFKKDGPLKKPLAISDKVTAGTTLNVETAKREEAERLKLDKFSADLEEKQMIATPIMVPSKLIPRLDDNGDKYYVYFTEETIEKIAHKFNKTLRLDNMNYEHDQDSPVKDVSLVENWLVADEDLDKSNIYGYNVPKGTWFGLFKVDNKQFWDEYVKTGKVKGVSAEGFFRNLKG